MPGYVVDIGKATTCATGIEAIMMVRVNFRSLLYLPTLCGNCRRFLAGLNSHIDCYDCDDTINPIQSPHNLKTRIDDVLAWVEF